MKKLRKKIVKILFVILTVLLIVCSLRRENTTYNINTQNVINYKYILVNKGNKLNNDFIPENLV